MNHLEKSTGFYGNLEESRFFSYSGREATGVPEEYLEQIQAIIQVCEDTDGILIVDKDGVILHQRTAMNYYWKEEV